MSRKTGLPRTKLVKREIPFSEALSLTPEKARRYATEDAVCTARNSRVVFEALRGDPKLYRYYREVEKPIVPILADMEHRGLRIDPDQILAFKHGLEEDKAVQEEILRSELGDINLNSNRQVAQALISRGIPLVETTETGEIATGKEVLLKAVGVYDPDDLSDFGAQGLVKDLLIWGNLDKMIGTYADPILEGLDSDSRLHPRFNQMVTNTNRLSSSNPNAQNMPSKGRHGRNIRRGFVVKDGYKLFKADYSQLELRILAHLTQEPVLLRAYRSEPEEDIHQLAADALHLMGKDGRKTAKIANFAFAFGAGDSGIARQTHRSMPEVKELMDRYRTGMPRFYGFKKVIASLLDQYGYVESLGGWRMYFPEWTSPVARERNTALREATNGPVQGSASWFVKMLMIAFDREVAEKYDAELDNQVHDELVGAVPIGAVREFSEDLERIGQEVAAPYLSVPLKLEVEIGDNWYDVKPWKEYLAV